MSFYKRRRPKPEEEKCADPAKARARALDALASREMSSAQLYERLCYGFTEQAAAAAVAEMVELDYVNDDRYAEARAHSLLAARKSRRAAAQNLCTNILFFLLEFWFGRKYIGLGTFVNGICIGYIVTAFYDPIHAHFGDAPSLAVQLAWVIAAVLVTALGASLYQTADLGIAPYDYLSLGLRDYTPCPYFGCRIFTDALSALLCWLLGGLVGLGTLICAFCLGPFIQFFDRTFSQKVLQYKPNN